jgi:DNA-binding transcriptional regulator of glucitol operon
MTYEVIAKIVLFAAVWVLGWLLGYIQGEHNAWYKYERREREIMQRGRLYRKEYQGRIKRVK